MDQVLRQTVGEIFIAAVAEIGERQNAHDGEPVLRRQAGDALRLAAARIGAGRLPGPDVDGIGDVLETVAAGIDHGDVEMPAYLAIGLCRNRDPAWRGGLLEADGDVHVVAKHLILVGDYIAHVDTESEMHGAIGGQMFVASRHEALHRDRGFSGADDARKLQEKSVAGVFDQTAAVIEADRVDGAAMGLEGGVRARLVGTHHAGVAGNICANNGCEASFHKVPALQDRGWSRCGKPSASRVYATTGRRWKPIRPRLYCNPSEMSSGWGRLRCSGTGKYPVSAARGPVAALMRAQIVDRAARQIDPEQDHPDQEPAAEGVRRHFRADVLP